MALAQIAILRGNYDEALVMLKTAEETMPESNLRMKEEMYKEISDTYFKLGDYENAYLNSIIYSEVKDSVLVAANLSKITQLSNVMAFENEMALKEESNEKLIALKQVEINRERLTRNIFLGGMLIAVMLVGLVFVRFVEKKKLSDKLNDTLENLQATQSQLVQQEKLASLGQLTAGIAHEIKNPLNFVNNFSEVSIEMIDEARDEVNKEIKDESQKTGILEILDDIEANLNTIHKHGSRADSIVKSMLQHSRGGSGKMEPTNLNELLKEYVNLAFHGMRAGKNPINVDIDLQLDQKVGNVPLVAEDFSRVILNLVNNAFDACAERSRSACAEHSRNLEKTEDEEPKTGESYKPKLTVRTVSDGNAVNIEIEDNGPGIPGEIKDSILQPFFTTKKGTAGTGLGLSITNDIVKAHRGIIDIKSEPGKTVFIIKMTR
jgi:signal transduction histidine kinase